MPPKVSITQENVLDAAFDIVRTRGLSALSARTVAETLGCSTQPIYRTFGSMTKLQTAVFERAAAVATQYLVNEEEESSFLSFGYGYLRFAQQEPQLCHLVAGAESTVNDLLSDAAPPEFVLEEMRRIPELSQLEEEQLRRIYRLIWFFCLGVASVFDAETDQDPMPMAREHLAMAGEAIINWELRGSER